jgi:UDP-N-acetylmuramate: L-alanyl-gamma-D-glutamyl-meso-diaminopimelate ligase
MVVLSFTMQGLLEDKMRVVILGVCGSLTSGIAIIAQQLGYEVLGFDRFFADPAHRVLQAHQITCYTLDDVLSHLKPTDCVIVANQMTRAMPLISELITMKIKLYSAPEWLGEFVLRKRKVIAVAGCHGKTTTTAMIASTLQSLGNDCGYLIAGTPNGLENPAHLGSSEYFVIEADEYDSAFFDKRPKFLHYWPHFLVLGTIEFDHADIYADFAQMLQQYKFLLRITAPKGAVVYSNLPNEFQDALDASKLAQYKTPCSKIALSIPGAFNESNAARAMLVCQLMGYSSSDILRCLAEFRGVKRRCEVVYKGLVTMIDDHAHHPTAVSSTLEIFKDQNTHLVYFPKTHTQRKDIHHQQLCEILKQAQYSYILLPEQHHLQIESYRQSGVCVGNEDEVFHALENQTADGDVILFCTPVRLVKLMKRVRLLFEKGYQSCSM